MALAILVVMGAAALGTWAALPHRRERTIQSSPHELAPPRGLGPASRKLRLADVESAGWGRCLRS